MGKHFVQAVIFDGALQKIFLFSQGSEKIAGCLLGRFLDEGDVVQVVDVNTRNCSESLVLDKDRRVTRTGIQLETVGAWFYGFRSDEFPLKRAIQAATKLEGRLNQNNQTPLILTLEGNESNYRIECHSFKEKQKPVKIDFEVANLKQRLFKRIGKIVGVSHLATKTVAIVGLGSGGSRVAIELAKCGVGTLKLVDYDRIEVENLARHICGIFDIGRLKTRVVRDLVLEHNPLTNVEIYNINVLESQDKFSQIIKESDAVVAATGSPVVNNLTNELCLSYKVSAIYAGAWERAMAGYVMRVIPGETPCFNCVHEVLLKTAPPLDQERIIDYSIVSDPNELKAEPGLSIDVGMITLLQAKLTLLTLLRGVTSGLEDIPQNYILWLNKSYDRFKSLTCLKLHTHRKEDCSVCNYDNWLKKKEEKLKSG
ncbi:hypothetical protein ES702_04161 [subsurface metagenome]